MKTNSRKKLLLVVLPLCFLFLFNGKKYEDAVFERINVPVKICMEGEACGKAAPARSMSTTNTASIKKVELSEGSEHIVKMLNMGDGGAMIFEPAVIKVSKGDTIHFKATDMSHNSETIPGMVTEGAEGWLAAGATVKSYDLKYIAPLPLSDKASAFLQLGCCDLPPSCKQRPLAPLRRVFRRRRQPRSIHYSLIP